MAKLNIPGYRINAHVGSGGMAVVFRAMQESLQRQVALKVLKETESKEWTERFLNEGRILASLSHRNIITVHDIGIYEGHIYISMEYLEGGDLRARIKSGITSKEALKILATIGEALEIAHKKGVIHRDVKPGNILFREDGTPVLCDYGIAKDFERDTDVTVDGTVIGTPDYLAPEQARIEAIDGRTDIYALGIIYYEMLTGSKPYEAGSPVEIVFKHLNEPIPRLPEAFAAYQPLLDKMTAKEPKDRFDDAADLLSAVTERRVNNAVGGLQKSKGRRKGDEKKKLGARAIARWAIAAVLVLTCGLVYWQRDVVLPLVEPYTGPIVDERGVMVDQSDRAVGTVLRWWESVAPYFAWKTVDASEMQLLRCRKEGRPNCDPGLAKPSVDESLAGNASATVQ